MQVFSSGKKLSQLFINMLEIKSHTGLQIDLQHFIIRDYPLICLLFSNSEATRPPETSHQTEAADHARSQERRFEPFHVTVGVCERPLVIQPSSQSHQRHCLNQPPDRITHISTDNRAAGLNVVDESALLFAASPGWTHAS